jgi:hypothetical protein
MQSSPFICITIILILFFALSQLGQRHIVGCLFLFKGVEQGSALRAIDRRMTAMARGLQGAVWSYVRYAGPPIERHAALQAEARIHETAF